MLSGLKDVVDFFVSKGAKDWEYGLFAAAKSGHKDLIDFLFLR